MCYFSDMSTCLCKSFRGITTMRCIEKPHRSYSHNATASFAVILWLIVIEDGFTSTHTRSAWRTAMSQFGKVAQPSIMEIIVVR